MALRRIQRPREGIKRLARTVAQKPNYYSNFADYGRGYQAQGNTYPQGGGTGDPRNAGTYQGFKSFAEGYRASHPDQFPGEQAAPGGAAPPPSAAPPAQPQDPRDSTYFSTVAKLDFQKANALNKLNTQESTQRQDLTTALQRMSAQRPADELKITQGANNAGLFYSGQLGKQMGDYANKYEQNVSDRNLSFDRSQAARVAARQAIEQGYTIDQAAALAAATERQTGRDMNNQDIGATDASPAAAGPATPGAPRFFLRPGVKLAPGQKAVAGAIAYLGKRKGRLGPSGGWHPI